MMSGQHQGKLVLEAAPKDEDPDFPIADRQPFLDPDATYLVMGGFGGLGLCLLSYLVGCSPHCSSGPGSSAPTECRVSSPGEHTELPGR